MIIKKKYTFKNESVFIIMGIKIYNFKLVSFLYVLNEILDFSFVLNAIPLNYLIREKGCKNFYLLVILNFKEIY